MNKFEAIAQKEEKRLTAKNDVAKVITQKKSELIKATLGEFVEFIEYLNSTYFYKHKGFTEMVSDGYQNIDLKTLMNGEYFGDRGAFTLMGYSVKVRCFDDFTTEITYLYEGPFKKNDYGDHVYPTADDLIEEIMKKIVRRIASCERGGGGRDAEIIYKK